MSSWQGQSGPETNLQVGHLENTSHLCYKYCSTIERTWTWMCFRYTENLLYHKRNGFQTDWLVQPTICLVLGRTTAWQPNICKIAQSSLYSWTMYIIIKNKVLPPYAKLPCHKVAFHFLFLNSAILHSCKFGHSCLYLLISPSILDIHQLFLLDCVG